MDFKLFLSTFLLFSGVAWAACPGDLPNGTLVPLYFGFMTAVDPHSDYVLAGIIPAVDLALELINNNTSILSGYELSYNDTIYDAQCSHRQGRDQFFSMISKRPPDFIALLGAGCSAATLPVAELAHYWNFPIVSYSSAAPMLSDVSLYPSFFRTYPSDGNFVPAFVGLVRGLGWKRVFILTEESPLFVQNERPLVEALSEAGIYGKSHSFLSGPDVDVAEVVRDVIYKNEHNNTHIFFLNMYSGKARAAFCAFYRLNMFYPNYAFIIPGWYQTGWWNNDAVNVSCSTRDLQTQLDRVLILQQLPVALNRSAPTISGLTADEFDTRYRSRLNDREYINRLPGPPSVYYPIPDALTAFDALWSLALGLDRVQRAVCANETLGCNGGPLTELEDFMYYNDQVECMVNKSLSMTGFEGVSGYVEFNANGTRVQEAFTIFQYQENTVRVLIGTLSLADNNTFRYRNDTAVWPNGIPPDGTEIKIINTIHVSLNVIFYTAAILGAVFAIGCLAFNVYFRNKKIIKLTSPNLNYTIGAGSLVMYSSVIFLLLPGLDTYSLHLRCIVGYWLAMIGYIIAFSAVLAKMWRVYYIFHNPTASKRTLKDWHLLVAVGVITSIVCLILIIGESIPQTRHEPTLVVDRETESTTNEFDVVVNYCTYSCYRSTTSVAFQALIMAMLFLLQAIGIFLAFQTRKVKVKVLNDAKQVTAIIYVTSVCVVLIIMTTFALGSFLNTSSAVFSLSIAAASTAFLILIFIPKMYNLYKDPDGENIFTGTHSSAAVPGIAAGAASILTGVQPGNSFLLRKESIGINMALATLGDDPKATIAVLEAKVLELEEELRNSKMNPGNPTKRGSLFPGFMSKNGLGNNRSSRDSTTEGSRASVTFEQPKDNLNAANSMTSPPSSVIRESSEEIEEGSDDRDNTNVTSNGMNGNGVSNSGDCVKNNDGGKNEEEGTAKTSRTETNL
uniref:G-protein coupled receptors family 3 profile domain-containing protein n=1 Tax=Amphimedon queenslandica TaxID=400682 RepID=A0A1X7VH94_AMPQE